MLPWAYCVIIDLSHYANAEKQLVCVCERVCGAVFFIHGRMCVSCRAGRFCFINYLGAVMSVRIKLVRREPLVANTRN